MVRQACPEQSRRVQHERSMTVIANAKPIALSLVEGCARPPRSNVQKKVRLRLARPEQKSKDRFLARLVSGTFLTGMNREFFNTRAEI